MRERVLLKFICNDFIKNELQYQHIKLNLYIYIYIYIYFTFINKHTFIIGIKKSEEKKERSKYSFNCQIEVFSRHLLVKANATRACA